MKHVPKASPRMLPAEPHGFNASSENEPLPLWGNLLTQQGFELRQCIRMAQSPMTQPRLAGSGGASGDA